MGLNIRRDLRDWATPRIMCACSAMMLQQDPPAEDFVIATRRAVSRGASSYVAVCGVNWDRPAVSKGTG